MTDMKGRTQITLDSEVLRQAQAKAASLGISFGEYVRDLIAEDLSSTVPVNKHVSSPFDLVDEGPETSIADEKDKMLGEAVWSEHLPKTDHHGRHVTTLAVPGRSATFSLFHQAILNRRQVICT